VEPPDDDDNKDRANGIGEIRDTPAQDALLIEIGHLQRDIEMLRQERVTAKMEYETLNTTYKELTGDLEKKTIEMRQARTASENERMKWQHRAETEENLKREIGDLKAQLQDQRNHLQSARRERDRLRPFEASFRELESNIKLTIEELDQRNEQLSKVQQLYDEINGKYATASNELNRMKNESRSTLDDAFFITKWLDLQASIKQWAIQYFWVQRNKWIFQVPQDHPNIDVELLKLSDDCSDGLLCLEGGSGRAIIAEAYLWRFIEEEIFDGKPASYSKGFIWADRLRPELCRMEEFLRPGELSYHSSCQSIDLTSL
jgi:predicted  nucleic acid-binding Zn-ribbon protein